MQRLDTIHDYLRSHSDEIGERILSSYPALHGADEAPSPLLSGMIRALYPAQTLAIMGVSKRWQLARNANVVAECGAGKTLIALGSMLVHSAEYVGKRALVVWESGDVGAQNEQVTDATPRW